MIFPALSAGVYLLALAVPTNAWDWVAHDVIQPFPNQNPGGAITKFQPLLSVINGCVPFPAVDVVGNGRAGAGLNPTGSLNGGCGSSPGQIYARAATTEGGVYGVYYSWYFPKDQILSGPVGLGHRNDWEGIIVFTTGVSASATITAICVARHGTAQDKWSCDKSNLKLSGNRPKIQYRPDGTHALFTSSTAGGSHPLVTWEGMPALARQMLTEADYGSANMPIKDANFAVSMVNAKRAAGF